jgi:formylglycine-generating enzyme required for sulfatase activity
VIGVSWYEAVAYCRWLTRRIVESGQPGWVARLLSEAEWEWVARGPEARRWPWGDKWEAGRCNTEESGIGRTSAVGGFPEGTNWTCDFPESGQGQAVYDLAGNVWEWCSTRWQENYPLPVLESEWTKDYLVGGDFRFLRGGSWFDVRSRARAACRGGCHPAFGSDYVGFRCCVATFSDVLDSGGSGGGAPSGAQKRRRRKRAR